MRKRTRFLWAVSVCLLVILGTEKRLAAAPAGEQGAPQLTGPAQVAIPATCFVAGNLVPAVCEVINMVQFGLTFSEATEKPAAMREVLQVLAKAASQRLVILSLGPAGSSVGAILAAYEYTARTFRTMQNRILSEMRDDPAKAELLRQFALADAQAVEAMIARVFAEHASLVDATRDYLMSNSEAPGIQFHCLLACQQLISAAQGANVFDTTPRVVEAGSAGPADVGLAGPAEVGSAGPANVIVPLAIAGGAGVGGYMLLNQYMPNLLGGCSPADPSPFDVCFSGQASSSACSTAQSQQDSFCSCEGYSGFDNRTGGCF